jgi:hypothetical protein
LSETLTAIPDAYVAPVRTLPQAELKVIAQGNPKALRLLTYGTRPPIGCSPPHNHGGDGGEVLDHALLSVVFGPYQPEDGSGTVKIGVPIPNVSGTVASDGLEDKLIASAPLVVPGGVSHINAYILVAWDGSSNGEAIDFHVALRSLSQTNQRYRVFESNESTYLPLLRAGTQTVTATGSAAYGSSGVFSLDLTEAGDTTLDREFELCVWKLSTASTTARHRLCALYVYPDTSDTAGGRSATRGDAPLTGPSVSELKAKATISTPLLSKVRTRLNQESRALLGFAPGLAADSKTPDRRRPYSQTVSAAHAHKGILCPDGSGGFTCEGAVLPHALAVQSYVRNLSENANQLASDVYPYLGIRIHPTGGAALDSKWLRLQYRISIPAGLGSLLLRFAARADTSDERTALTVRAHCNPVAGGSSIVKGIRTPSHSSTGTDADGYYKCEVAPIPNDAYQNMSKRRGAAKAGGWTQAACLTEGEAPASVEVHNAYQISEPVEIFLSHPAVRSTDTYHATGDYLLSLRFDLLELDTGTFDAGARLNWVLVTPGRGW